MNDSSYKYIVSTSPHITSPRTTKRIMADVIIALVPALIASFLLYGFYTLLMTAIAVAATVFGEYLFNLLRGRKHTVNDLSAVVTGIILGLNLPPTVPFYVPAIGGLFAALIVKMLFGGIGKNFANPALTARIFVMLAWTTAMTSFVAPIDLSKGGMELFKYFNSDTVSALTTATPLAGLKEGLTSSASALDLFLGRIGGSAGEVSALAILIGGVYLAARKVIDLKIPLLYVLTYFVVTCIIYKNASVAGLGILSGGLLFGAVFMATDYSTSPNSFWGVVIYAVGCGILTAVFRKYSAMSEGVSYAILLMNIVTPLLDKYIRPRPFGYVKPVREKKERKVKRVKEVEAQ